jgi:predicted glutamine amidotransferase
MIHFNDDENDDYLEVSNQESLLSAISTTSIITNRNNLITKGATNSQSTFLNITKPKSDNNTKMIESHVMKMNELEFLNLLKDYRSSKQLTIPLNKNIQTKQDYQTNRYLTSPKCITFNGTAMTVSDNFNTINDNRPLSSNIAMPNNQFFTSYINNKRLNFNKNNKKQIVNEKQNENLQFILPRCSRPPSSTTQTFAN